jgi:hypothetical protein
MAACSSDLMFRRVGNSSGKGDEIPRVQHFFRNSLWRVNGGVNAGQWGRAKPSPVCAVIELEARVRPGGDGRGFVTGAGVVISPVSGLAAAVVVHVAVAARRAAAPASAAPAPTKRPQRPTKSRRVGISGRAPNSLLRGSNSLLGIKFGSQIPCKIA